MLASGLRHLRTKFVLSPPLYPASHAAKSEFVSTPISRNPMLLSLPWGEAKEERKEEAENKAVKSPQNALVGKNFVKANTPNTRKRKV